LPEIERFAGKLPPSDLGEQRQFSAFSPFFSKKTEKNKKKALFFVKRLAIPWFKVINY
jgi:hypothetical protein